MSRAANATGAGPSVDVEGALRTVVGFLRVMTGSRRRPPQQPSTFGAACEEFRRAAKLNPDAEIDATLLRELAGFLSSPVASVAAVPAWSELLVLNPSKKRVQLLLGVEGAAAALAELLRSDQLTRVSHAAAALYCLSTEEFLPLLLASAPDVLDTAVAALVKIVPRAAAAEVGLPAVVGGAEVPPSPALPQALTNILLLLSRLAKEFGLPGREATSPPREAVPALVAAMAAPEIDVTQLAAMALGTLLSSCPRPELAARCFWLGERGLVRGLRRCFEEDLRQLRARSGRPSALGPPLLRAAERPIDSLLLSVYVVWDSLSHVCSSPKHLLAPAAAAWAEGSGRLQAALVGLQGVRNQDAGSDCCKTDVDVTFSAIRWLGRWRARSAALCAEAGTLAASGAEGASGGAAVLRRQCAACGKTRADGAHLRRCRGCGDVTGVMYCGEACARQHWVKKGHRALCGRGKEALRELKEEATVVWVDHEWT